MKSLDVREMDIPKPDGDEVLVKVAAAPCNPSDIAFMRGGYNIRKPLPAIMGFECSGTVVETGSNMSAMKFLGKRVSCFTQGPENGTWAEYFVTKWQNCIVLRDEIDFDQAAALCVNPFTAYLLFRMARNKGCRAIIQNGASGQVGIAVRILARKANIKVINIVRKEEQVDRMHSVGERLVLNMTSPEFESSLRLMAHENHATMAFDAVAGDLTGTILNAMPAGSEIVVYGGLSGKPIGSVNAMDIIFQGKTIKGFNLGDWKQRTDPETFDKVAVELQQLIHEGTLRTAIQGTFSLGEVQTAMEQYIRNMSAGKILFHP